MVAVQMAWAQKDSSPIFFAERTENDSIQREEGLCRKHEQNWKNSQFFLGRSSPEKIQTKPFLLAKVHWPISMVLCLDFHWKIWPIYRGVKKKIEKIKLIFRILILLILISRTRSSIRVALFFPEVGIELEWHNSLNFGSLNLFRSFLRTLFVLGVFGMFFYVFVPFFFFKKFLISRVHLSHNQKGNLLELTM